MRCFATPDGRTLVEWEAEPVDVLKPAPAGSRPDGSRRAPRAGRVAVG